MTSPDFRDFLAGVMVAHNFLFSRFIVDRCYLRLQFFITPKKVLYQSSPLVLYFREKKKVSEEKPTPKKV